MKKLFLILFTLIMLLLMGNMVACGQRIFADSSLKLGRLKYSNGLYIGCVSFDSIPIAHKCPKGYQWVSTMNFDYHVFLADTCMSDSAAVAWYNYIIKSTCGTGIAEVGNGWYYWSGNRWNDSLQICESVKEWKIKVKTVWIKVEESEFKKVFPDVIRVYSLWK